LPYGVSAVSKSRAPMCTEPALLCLDEPAAGLNAAKAPA